MSKKLEPEERRRPRSLSLSDMEMIRSQEAASEAKLQWVDFVRGAISKECGRVEHRAAKR